MQEGFLAVRLFSFHLCDSQTVSRWYPGQQEGSAHPSDRPQEPGDITLTPPQPAVPSGQKTVS